MRDRNEILDEVTACTSRLAEWPTRRGDESGLGRPVAEQAFAECVAGLVADHRMAAPAQFTADGDAWNTMFAYEPIERHASFFALRRTRRSGNSARDRPYDQMAIAFPAATSLVPPLLLGRAIDGGSVELSAFEPVIVVRKPRDANPRPHLHIGKARCGGTLNALALIAHCLVEGEARCLVIGSRPLSCHQDLQQSVPVALREMLADVDVAALTLLGSPGRALALAPVVADVLVGGGPAGKGGHNATNTELVAARTKSLLQMVYQRSVPAAVERNWPTRLAAFRVPTEPLSNTGPHRIAPNGLEPVGTSWPKDPHKFADEVAKAPIVPRAQESIPSPDVASEIGAGGDVQWCSVPALLTGVGPSSRVALFARRPGDASRPTVWLTANHPTDAHITAVEAHRRSRVYDAMPTRMLATPYDLWVHRAYRHHASGDLLLKGGGLQSLVAGVSAAMTAAFLLFAMEHRSGGE